MGKKKKINPTSLPKNKSAIKPTSVARDEDRFICFSFKYLREGKNKFIYKNLPLEYFLRLITSLEEFSKKTIKEYYCDSALKSKYRCHEIDWADTTEISFGIPNEEQIVDKPWQLFKLTDNKWGRVHGFIIDNCFFIVWLDKEHELYPKE